MVVILNDFLDIYNKLLAERKLSNKTLTNYNNQLIIIRKALGEKSIEHISLKDISIFLYEHPPCQRNHYRGLLINIFKHAVAMGFCEQNPAAKTLKTKYQKERNRLCKPGYDAIYNYLDENDAWLRCAMDVGLHTLQRLTDVCNMQFTDIKGDHLYLKQSKTKKQLKMRIRPPFRAVIERCRDNILSPYLIHRLPNRLSAQNLRLTNRSHPTQVLPEYCTKAFTKARDKCGFFDAIEPAKRPTYHEIRSLGAHYYEKQREYPKNLLGHSSENMTERYLDGHDRFIEVEVGLLYI